MSRSSGKFWLFAIALLVIAHTGAIAHAYEHELGAPQDQTCVSCVVASHILSACIDNGLALDIRPYASCYGPAPERRADSIALLSPRQRGPPAQS